MTKPASSSPPPQPPSPSPPSQTTIPNPQSNESDAAVTVANTVMAEQISHHVVNNSESTGGSLPVDAAVNQTTQAFAGNGSNFQTPADTKTSNELANDANAALNSNIQATTPAAGPSAGSAADGAAGAPAVVAGFEKPGEGQPSLTNGIADSASVGDSAADNVSVQGSADVSVHSDTEGSKGDSLEQKDDDKYHARTNSVKKPATFSKVSVTKNFLAKSASPAPSTTTKLGDKPSPSGTPPAAASAAKPRLIAKSGTALRDVQKSRLGAEGAGGPDASKVWNKNRPAAPPPPKQFTDEELKQQFGIHMATRLQSDENGKDAKWADIDDEEEDWAPEAVVWMDGTKSTLNAQEAAAPPAEAKPAAPQEPKPAETIRPTLALKKPVDLGPQKTILKPGAGAAAAQARQNGSGAGTPTEKPSLKAKSPAPTPAKSPWAVLPPVDKISPINPPVQQAQQPQFASQDARAYEPMPPPAPAREIGADTFERSWRDGEGARRELYNAANGRYEPVPEGRRASKHDATYRKPSVLQRPSFGAPAEPSPAFQSRTTQMDGSGARRRGSSVSQGSVPPRRMSMSKPQETVPERRPSMVIGHDMRTSPNMGRNEPAQPMFAQQSAWQQQMPPQPEGEAEPQEDPVKAQERIMREKRETAKKRREEQEAKEEAEKQERLRARLAALEGAGKSRKEREAEAAAAAAAAAASAQTTPATELPPADRPHYIAPQGELAQAAKPTEAATIAAPAIEAQTLPSAPSPATLQQQQPTLPEDTLPSPLPSKSSPALQERPISSADQNQRQSARNHLSPRASTRAPFQQTTAPYRAPTSSYSSPGDRKQQPFTRSPFQTSDTISSPWPTTAPNGNVWGTSSGIGNGTFESASSFAPMPMSQQNSSLPPPPGMSAITRPSTSTRISPQGIAQGSRSPSLQQQSVAEPTHRGFAPPGLDSRPDPFAQQARANGSSPAPGMGRQTHLPGPIAPPSRAQAQQNTQPGSRPDPLSAWNNAAQRLPYEYRNQAAAEPKKEAAAPREDTIKETFKKTSGASGRLGGPRKYDTTEHTIHDGSGSRAASAESPAPPVAQTQPAGPFSTASPMLQETKKPVAENTVRIPDGSLNPAHGGTTNTQPPIGPPHQQRAASSTPSRGTNFTSGPLPPAPTSVDQSPPPPEEATHPVNSGSASHPLVRLPSTQPKPVVRLPPSSPQAPASSQQPNQVSMPHRPISTWGAPPGSKPIVMSEAWQARFNGLFQRTPIQTETPPSPPKTPPKMQVPAAAVTSSTRANMSEMPTEANAIVSLPQNGSSPKGDKNADGFTIDDSKEVTSKDVIENMFMQEQSFGSLPTVTIPKNPTYDAQVYEKLTRNLLHMGSNPKFFKATETQSALELSIRDIHPIKGAGIYISLPQVKDKNGKALSKLVLHPHRRQPSGRFNKGPAPKNGKDATPPTGPSSTPESRKTSFQAQKAQDGTGSPVANGANRRGGWAKPIRGGGNHGNTRRPAPVTPS